MQFVFVALAVIFIFIFFLLLFVAAVAVAAVLVPKRRTNNGRRHCGTRGAFEDGSGVACHTDMQGHPHFQHPRLTLCPQVAIVLQFLLFCIRNCLPHQLFTWTDDRREPTADGRWAIGCVVYGTGGATVDSHCIA